MCEGCLRPDEFEGLAPDDPRRAHLEECPRCRAVMKSFEEFRDVADVPDGIEVVEAHARLSAALEGEIGAGEFGEPVGEEGKRPSSIWRRLLRKRGGT